MTVKTYRKKPVTVEAIQWTGHNADEVRDFVGQISSPGEFGFIRASYARPARLWVAANQEWLLIEPGEWVLKDKLGFYPCKDEMFQHSYEEAS